jgi:hypothetical protein
MEAVIGATPEKARPKPLARQKHTLIENLHQNPKTNVLGNCPRCYPVPTVELFGEGI